MINIMDYPLVIFVLSFFVQWLAARFGATFLRKILKPKDDSREDLGTVLTASLTLLGLIIGFSFSMAISRYDQRKNLEEGEANAIGTQYLRADLLPAADAAKVRALLRDYLDQRILRYQTRDEDKIREIGTRTARMQLEMWAAVAAPAAARPEPVIALAVSGMNDVLNSQGYTQAARWNRIPAPAWALMGIIAVCCNLLVGYGARNFKAENAILLVLPFVVSVAFLLIADIDSPTGGMIRVNPQNIESVAEWLRAP